MTVEAGSLHTVSALICTRNRAQSLLRTVSSLLGSRHAEFQLIVMDQSEGPESENVLAACQGDRRLQYVRSRGRGKGVALNEGLRLATGDIVVCTDDDCEAPPGWVTDMARVLEKQPTAAIVFCDVTAGKHDNAAGYVPVYHATNERLLRSVSEARHGLGLGAGMALRRQAVLAFGGFDETFGPGAKFASGDDWDLSLRALVSGWHVYNTTSVSIVHHGFRTMVEGRDHAVRDWFAIGALFAKPLRAGYVGAVAPAGWLFVREALWPPVRALLRLRRPSGLSRIVAFVRGFTGGLFTPIDRKTLLFRRMK